MEYRFHCYKCHKDFNEMPFQHKKVCNPNDKNECDKYPECKEVDVVKENN